MYVLVMFKIFFNIMKKKMLLSFRNDKLTSRKLLLYGNKDSLYKEFSLGDVTAIRK